MTRLKLIKHGRYKCGSGEKESYNKFIKMQSKYPYPPIAQLAMDSHAAEWLQQIETNISTLTD